MIQADCFSIGGFSPIRDICEAMCVALSSEFCAQHDQQFEQYKPCCQSREGK